MLVPSVPRIQYIWPDPHCLLPQSYAKSSSSPPSPLSPPCSQTPILSSFPPKYLGSGLPSRPHRLPAQVEALPSFSGVCGAASELLPINPFPSGSSRTIFLKWKSGPVMCLPKTHPDLTQDKPQTPSQPTRQAHLHGSQPPLPLAPFALATLYGLEVLHPTSEPLHMLFFWPRIPFFLHPPPYHLSNTQ